MRELMAGEMPPHLISNLTGTSFHKYIKNVMQSLEANMTTMIAEVYEALIEAGASQEKAKKAAESIAAYENRFNKIEVDLLVIKWMLGLVVAGIFSLVVKAFFV